MNTLFIDLKSRYLSRYPFLKRETTDITTETELDLGNIFKNDGVGLLEFDSTFDKSKLCGLILLYISFTDNDKHLKKKLLKYLRDFMQEIRKIHVNFSDYICFAQNSFNDIIHFVAENMMEDIHTNSTGSELTTNCSEEYQEMIKKYAISAQYFIGDVFEMFLTSAGLDSKEVLCLDSSPEILFEGMYKLDTVFKRLLIYMICVHIPSFKDQEMHLTNGNVNFKTYVEIDQHLLLSIISILNRISSITINSCSSIGSLKKYFNILYKMECSDELYNKETRLNKTVYFIFYRILCINDLSRLNKDLITSIGMFSSLLYISEKILDCTSNEYKSLNDIMEHAKEHIERFEFSNTCRISFYRGLVVYCSMIYDITRHEYPIYNDKIFEVSFNELVHLTANYKSEEDSAYGLQSLLTWISRLKYEILKSDVVSKKASAPCFYLNQISEILLSFLDQPMIYYSKLANQILEEFIDYLIIIDSLIEQKTIEEIGSDPFNWFFDLILNNTLSNKYKFLSLYLLFNGILNNSKSNINRFKGRFCKLSKVINFSLDKLDVNTSNGDFIGVQLLHYLVFSLSMNNTSSSSQNLILAWFNLRKKILLGEKNIDQHNWLFLDFIFNTSTQIIKRNSTNCNFENEIITIEGKSNMFARMLHIFKKSDVAYYYDKLPTIFSFYFEEMLNRDNMSYKKLSFIQIQILVELKRNGFLLWENEICADNNLNKLGMTIIFKDSTSFSIDGICLINSLISNDMNVLTHILELLSLSLKPSIFKNYSCKGSWLLSEMESLYIILCDINPLNICSGILFRIISIFDQLFTLIKKLLQNNAAMIDKTVYYKWLQKLLIYLKTSIGLQVSTAKVDFYLPIFCALLETFSSEEYIGNVFEYQLSNKYSTNSFVQNLNSQLFSSSNYCSDIISDLLIYNQKLNPKINQLNVTATENVSFINRIYYLMKESPNNIRLREYYSFNVLIYYYMKNTNTNSDYQVNLSMLFKQLFSFSGFECLKKRNTHTLIGEVLYLETNIRIRNFCSNGLFVHNLMLGNNGIPLQSIINLYLISFKAEFTNNSKNRFISLCEESLKMIYIFTLLLFILTDSNLTHDFSEKLHTDINRKNGIRVEADLEYLNYNISRTVNEICSLFKVILSSINLDTIFETAHKPLNLALEKFNAQNVHFDAFLNHLNAIFVSEESYYFIHRLCAIYMNFILKCDHPGNSENLLETFSAILNSVHCTNKMKCSISQRPETRVSKFPWVKIDVPINNETVEALNGLSYDIRPTLIIPDSGSVNNKIVHSNQQIEYLSKNLLLYIIYSLISTDELHYECNKDQTATYVNDFTLDNEQIDKVFDMFVTSAKYGHKDEYHISNCFLDANKLFKCGNSMNNVEKLYIPSPKRKSNNLCRIICILVSVTIRYFMFHQLIKYTIKILIIASLNNTTFHQRKGKLGPDSEDNISRGYKCSIHSNHILAALVPNYKSGSGTNYLCEIFDLNLLCGSLFSAINNIKMYDFRAKDENGFILCNSSLNLMSALLKRFSLKANGIESNVECIRCSKNIGSILNNEFKVSELSDNVLVFYRGMFKDTLSAALNRRIDSYYSNPFINEMNTTRFSLKSITSVSRIFEACIIDILLYSNDSQFQGMILLLLSEISITWMDCSFDLAICMIKSIYSRSYFVRIHSAKLLGEIILRTLNMSHINTNPFEYKPNKDIDETLLEIFVNNSIDKHSLITSIIQLIHQSVKTSIRFAKANLIHGILNLGIILLKKLKNNSGIAYFEPQQFLIYNNLLDFIGNEYMHSSIHTSLKIPLLQLIGLLLELNLPIKGVKLLDALVYHWKNNQTITKMVYLELFNLSSPFECTNKTQNFINEDLTEPIYLIKIIASNTTKHVYLDEFNSLIGKIFTPSKIIHPKILSEFYSSIMENLYNLPELNFNFIQLMSNLIFDHLSSIDYLILEINKSYPLSDMDKNRIVTIIMELICVLIYCLYYIAIDKRSSHNLLGNEHFSPILKTLIGLIYNKVFSEYMNCSSANKYLESGNYFNGKNEEFCFSTLDSQVSMLHISVLFVRYYENITGLEVIPSDIVVQLEKVTFEHFLKMIYSSMSYGRQITIEEKLLVCDIIQVIFDSLELQLSSKTTTQQESNEKAYKKTNMRTIIGLFCADNNYWYNLMISLIYLMTDESPSVEERANHIFYSFHHIIKYFCNNFLQINDISDCAEFNSNSGNNIEQLILLNDHGSCLFSIRILNVVYSSLGSIEVPNNPVLFPKELDNICNEYLTISQIATNKIINYLETLSPAEFYQDYTKFMVSHFELWEEQIKKETILFERVYNCIKDCPSQLVPIELYGSILADEPNILLFVLLIKKLEIVSKYKMIVYGESSFENTVFDFHFFFERINFLISDVHRDFARSLNQELNDNTYFAMDGFEVFEKDEYCSNVEESDFIKFFEYLKSDPKPNFIEYIEKICKIKSEQGSFGNIVDMPRLKWMILLHIVPIDFFLLPIDDCYNNISVVLEKERINYMNSFNKNKLDISKMTSMDPSKFHPLSQTADNPWNEQHKNCELLDEIWKDITRTYSERELFSKPNTRQLLQRILFTWTRENPDFGYKQGMNEIAAILFLINFSQKISVNRQNSEIEPHSSGLLGNCKHSLEHIFGREYIEADTYIMFNSVMNSFGLKYMFQTAFNESNSNDNKSQTDIGKPPIVHSCMNIYRILEKVDHELFNHLYTEHGIEPQLIFLRWIRLLFSREFSDLNNSVIIWEYIFCDASQRGKYLGNETKFLTSMDKKDNKEICDIVESCLPIVNFIAVSILLTRRNLIINSDFNHTLKLIVNQSNLSINPQEIFSNAKSICCGAVIEHEYSKSLKSPFFHDPNDTTQKKTLHLNQRSNFFEHRDIHYSQFRQNLHSVSEQDSNAPKLHEALLEATKSLHASAKNISDIGQLKFNVVNSCKELLRIRRILQEKNI
ncbi:hypothetical protein OJ252_2100 [Cryptosporidium canis]|uniref:Rab-GAP TBC domain-containing protein n=1 Tax=Cryptosporidium canis TaxID=195482 RepID=A0ABQ8P8G7_9CRYT|nr:hypothetical protein OJ252_2100 [Cryptosporidium canis]